MKKLVIFACLSVAIAIVAGCGTQNEDLSKGKEWVKSDKRGRIPKAVDFFEKAIVNEPDNAEAHYLLGYYDEDATIERRAEQMVKSFDNEPKKYLDILIEEAVRDRDENVRKSASKALQEIYKKDPERCMKRLIKTLKSKDSRDRDDAALVMSTLHNHRAVVDILVQKDILKHKRMNTRFDAVRALGNIGDPRAIDPLMERITALKTEDEKGEEPEVRRAAVVALRQIARRNIDITGTSLNIKVESADEGVTVVDVPGELANKITLQKGEVISHIIDNREITSLEDYNDFLAEALRNSDTVTFGLPKIVEVIASKIDELGIDTSDIEESPSGGGIVIGKLAIESKARKMGVEKGETISHINHQRVNSVQDYERLVNAAISKGEKVGFTVANMDKYKLLSIQAPGDGSDLGMTVEAMPPGAEGVVVTSVVEPRSAALEAGVRKGQIFSYIVNEGKINSVDEYNRLLTEGLADGEVTISVVNRTAVDRLIDVLRNKGLIVRFDAAQALGEVQDARAVESLIEMLGEQANPIEISIR